MPRDCAQQQTFLDQLIQSLPGAFCYLDRDLIVRRVNAPFARLFKRSEEDLLGKPLVEIVRGREEPLAGLLRAVLASGRPVHAERVPFPPSEASGPPQSCWDLHLHPVREPDGSVSGILVHGVEVSERPRLEAPPAKPSEKDQKGLDIPHFKRQPLALRKSHRELERLRRLQRHAFEFMVQNVEDYAIFMLDSEGRLMTWNAGAEAISGYSEPEILGQPFARFFRPEEAKAGKPQHLLERALAEGSVEDDGWRVRKNGERFWAHAAVTAVRDQATLLGFVSVVRDMTEPRRIEAVERELAALGKLDRMKDDFLSVISHELRTPLNFITGFASILDDEVAGPLNPDQKAYVRKILNGADRMLFQVNNLVEMSRMTAGKLSIQPSYTLYGGLVAHVLDALRPLADSKRIRLGADVRIAEEVLLDGQRVTQVVRNLVDNAIKFTPDGGSVTVKAYPMDGLLVTEVSDTGIGIAEEDLPKLFQRFVQLDMTSTRTVGGTGLGLALCKSIVEAHGGSIGVRSEGLGKGSTFWFTLPLARVAAERA